jgi:hypothetical protein
MHTPSKLSLEILAEMQRQAATDFGMLSADADALMAGAEIAGNLAHRNGDLDERARASWLERMRESLRALRSADRLTPYQDALEQRLITGAHTALVARTAHITNVDIPARIVLGSLPIGQSNAITVEIEETSEFLILLQRGLFGTLNLLARVIAGAWPDADDPGEPLPILIETGKALDRMRADERLTPYIIDVLDHSLLKGDPQSLAVLPMPANREGLKETILLNAEMFVIGHELGHISRSHFSRERNQTSTRGNLALTVKSRSHQEEFAADLSAFEFLTAACTQDPASLCLSYYGACFFLSCQDFLEAAIETVSGAPGEQRLRDTHPTGAKRRAAITNVVRSHLGPAKTKILEDAYGAIQSVLDFAWDAAKPEWTRVTATGQPISPVWASAFECQVRPGDQEFEVETADSTLQALGLGTSEDLEQIKGAVFLPLLEFFGENPSERDDAAAWLLDNAHLSVACLIHELGMEPNWRGAQFVDHLVGQKPGLTTWVNTLRFIVERYAGNVDILGVPEVLPELGVGIRYLQSLARNHLDRVESDYVRLYLEAARAEHVRMFGNAQ